MSATDQQSTVEAFIKAFAADVAEQVAAKLGATQAEPDRLLTLAQVADRLGMTERAVRNLTYSMEGKPPQLASLKVGNGGGAVRVESSTLEAFIEARRVASRTETQP